MCDSEDEAAGSPSQAPSSPAPPQQQKSLYDGGVGVVVRVRPLSTVERADPSQRNCVQCLKDYVVVGGTGAYTNGTASARPSTTTTSLESKGASSSVRTPCPLSGAALPKPAPVARPQQFQVDHVFHPHSSQIEVYEQSCRPIVEGVYQGINGAILAYGATGSGKTHTMFGGAMSAAGVVYQAAQDIFAEKSRLEEEEGKLVTVRCSFLEIYNEEVFDLLPSATAAAAAGAGSVVGSSSTTGGGGQEEDGESGAGTSRAGGSAIKGGAKCKWRRAASQTAAARVPLQVRELSREDKAKLPNPEHLVVCGLNYVYPQSADEFARFIEAGQANRFVAATGANAQSSRSHAIITVEVVVASKAAVGHEGTVARVRFCDLAGSERAAATSNSGVRMREGGNINRSLLALGAVVQSLVQGRRHPHRQVFVPYRGSKLTRLLRDGIGGNCRTQILFCLSPSTRQYEDSVNTMLFAMQAKEIRVRARRNEYNTSGTNALVKEQEQQIIEELRAELAAARDELMRLGVPLQANNSIVVPMGGSATTAQAHATAAGTPNGTDRQSVGARSAGGPVSPLVSDASAGQDPSAPSPTSFAEQQPGQAALLGASSKSESMSASQISSGASAAFSPAAAASTTATATATALERQISGGTPATPGPTCSPGRTTTTASTSRPARPSVFQEGSYMFTELETKLKAYSAEKESLYHQMRDAEEQQQDRDIRLREQKWKLARFLASNAMNCRAHGMHGGAAEVTSGGTVVTPIGVAGLRQVIAAMEAETETQDERMMELAMKLDSVDRQIASTRQELLREKQQPLLELLLDNAKLRQNCTEAECLAAHYHQECRTSLHREQEYAEALQTCVSALRSAMPVLPFTSPQLRQAKVSLLYAGLPTASTEDMLHVFENSLRVEATPPLVPQATSPSAPPSPSHTLAGKWEEAAPAASASPALPPMVPASPKRSALAQAADSSVEGPPPRQDAFLSSSFSTPPRGNASRLPEGTTTEEERPRRPTSDEGGVDLEQHYRELVEAASCLKNLSPMGGGRGARRDRTPTPSKAEKEWEAELAKAQGRHHGSGEGKLLSSTSFALIPENEESDPLGDEKQRCDGSAVEKKKKRAKRLAPPPSATTSRHGNAVARKPSPYARTFSTSSFHKTAATKPTASARGGGVEGGSRSHTNGKSAFTRTHTVPAMPTAGNTTHLSPSSSPKEGKRATTPGGGSARGAARHPHFTSSSPLGHRSRSIGAAPREKDGNRKDRSITPTEQFRRIKTDTCLASPLSNARAQPPHTNSASGKAVRAAAVSPPAAARRAAAPVTRGRQRAPVAATAPPPPPPVNNNSNSSSNKKKKVWAEHHPAHSPVITQMPKNQRPHIFVRSNTAFALRAGQALATPSSNPKTSGPAGSPRSGGKGGGKAKRAKQERRSGDNGTTSASRRLSDPAASGADSNSSAVSSTRSACRTDGQGNKDSSTTTSDRSSNKENSFSHELFPVKSSDSMISSQPTTVGQHGLGHSSDNSPKQMGKKRKKTVAAHTLSYAAVAAHCGRDAAHSPSASLATPSCVSNSTVTSSGMAATAAATAAATTTTTSAVAAAVAATATRGNTRKASIVSTLTSGASQTGEDELLVSRSTCPEGVVWGE